MAGTVNRDQFVFVGNAGISNALQGNTSPRNIFEAFISEDIIKVLVDETNLYAEHFIEEKR